MYIDSSQQDFDITKINSGFIYSDGSVYGVDDYQQGYKSHDKILTHYGIEEEVGCIRFCSSYILKESYKFVHRNDSEVTGTQEDVPMTTIQFNLIKQWMNTQEGSIKCTTTFDKVYQISYLKNLDQKQFENIIRI